MKAPEPDGIAIRDLINKLRVIVICCDLLTEGPDENSERRRRLQAIRTSAKAIAQQLDECGCDIDRILPIAATMSRQIPS
jgi:hypothetical protein